MSDDIKAATAAELSTVAAAKPALRNLLLGLLLALLSAAATFIGNTAPELAAVVVGVLPGFLKVLIGPKLEGLIQLAAAYLLARARNQTKDAVIEAKAQTPTQSVRDLYVKKQFAG